MSFEDNLRIALDDSAQLPPQLHLGLLVYSWTNGILEFKCTQAGWRQLTADELRQLARRLRAAPQHHVVFLNLYGHDMGSDVVQEMAPAIATLDALQVLILNGNYFMSTFLICWWRDWGCIIRCGASVFTRCSHQDRRLRLRGARSCSPAPLGASNTATRT
jgi:hypothetical protein